MESKPFLIWVGGKQKIVKQLLMHIPEQIGIYHEPFLGGGALLLAIQPTRVFVSDINYELISTYKALSKQELCQPIINKLLFYLSKNLRNIYNQLSATHPTTLSTSERTARFILLNKLSYGGVYREKEGLFKVQFGNNSFSMKTIKHIKDASNYLSKSKIVIGQGDYADQLRKHVNKGDFIYLDSPYYLLKKSSYSQYNGLYFDQKKLAQVFKWLDAKGCKVLLSNSNCSEIKNRYTRYKIIEIEVDRGFGIGKVKELLIKNY